jgi:hypothetical protein
MLMITETFVHKMLYGENPYARKLCSKALAIPRAIARVGAPEKQYASRPPVLANSLPKSGTHLLVRLLESLPDLRDYGAFLASMHSSFVFRERSMRSTMRYIDTIVPGELLRAHLYFDPEYRARLSAKHVIHYFIYRDLRDVAVSEAHYFRTINRWHRLHPVFRQMSTEQAITAAICGISDSRFDYPNIAVRFKKYQGWVDARDVCAISYESLRCHDRRPALQKIIRFYTERCPTAFDADSAMAEIDKACERRSHTFRSGHAGGWQMEFSDRHKTMFKEIAGDLLVSLGFAESNAW